MDPSWVLTARAQDSCMSRSLLLGPVLLGPFRVSVYGTVTVSRPFAFMSVRQILYGTLPIGIRHKSTRLPSELRPDRGRLAGRVPWRARPRGGAGRRVGALAGWPAAASVADQLGSCVASNKRDRGGRLYIFGLQIQQMQKRWSSHTPSSLGLAPISVTAN